MSAAAVFEQMGCGSSLETEKKRSVSYIPPNGGSLNKMDLRTSVKTGSSAPSAGPAKPSGPTTAPAAPPATTVSSAPTSTVTSPIVSVSGAPTIFQVPLMASSDHLKPTVAPAASAVAPSDPPAAPAVIPSDPAVPPAPSEPSASSEALEGQKSCPLGLKVKINMVEAKGPAVTPVVVVSDTQLDPPAQQPLETGQERALADRTLVQTPVGCPLPDKAIERDDLIKFLSQTLQQLYCDKPFMLAVADGKTHPSTFMFQCKTVPSMTITQYAERVGKYTGISGEAMLLAVVAIVRVSMIAPNFPLNILTIHRLFLTCCLIYAKYFDDSFLNNVRYARCGGIAPVEMNVLEIELLFLFDFNLYVSLESYAAVYKFVSAGIHKMKAELPSPPGGLSAVVDSKTVCHTPPTPKLSDAVKTCSDELVAEICCLFRPLRPTW
jgi:hypothetical protein